MKQATVGALIACVVVTAILAPSALSKKKNPCVDGATVFKQNCQTCHAGGGNSVKPKKPIAGSAKLANLGIFKSYLQNPLGHMPYYKHIVTDQQTLKALYDYCKTLKPSKGA